MKLSVGSYDNSTTVDNEAEILADFQRRSQLAYQRCENIMTFSYGEKARERIDWFISPKEKAGTIVFIHGGYWQSCNKEDFAFITTGPLALGFDVMLAEYSLAPQATLTMIHHQIGAALDAIARQPGVAGPVYLSGHSAGGHLAACWQAHPGVEAVLAISGIFELEPLLTTAVNHQLQLTAQEVRELSPLRHVPAQAAPLTLFYGSRERPELIAQSEYYAQQLCQQGRSIGKMAIENANHYSILDALFATDGALFSVLCNYRKPLCET
ncbi:acetyl esterase/lipase [Raoultella sp. BIGb0399]|uniref:alpha/beta hydrolase n=1 Tax=unclassified Raoultella TaxID=2627600 RepID=UPI000F4B0266|nr:alpha/beta hydrolase [Raoultella sp. BIGb0399]ROS13607.1 acetyl esterase/lipase [Raoultella sp. BIGb0399]